MHLKEARGSKLFISLIVSLSFLSVLTPQMASADLAVIEGVSGQCIATAGIITTDTPGQYMVVSPDVLFAVCTPQERAALEGRIVPLSSEIQGKLDEYEAQAKSCGWFNMSACLDELWDRFIVFIGFLPVALGGFLLNLAGNIFDYLLDHTIAQFGALLSQIIGGINTAWTAFRDIANIVIIGMFTFIAISLILGIKEYGERKMIARVLVVAVLINFSLLFTNLITDASNFTALQFYKAAQLQTGDTGSGISEAFLQSMGATSVGSLYGVL